MPDYSYIIGSSNWELYLEEAKQLGRERGSTHLIVCRNMNNDVEFFFADEAGVHDETPTAIARRVELGDGKILKCIELEHDRYRTLIFALQAAWPLVHGSRDTALIEECGELLRSESEISAERNDQIYAALERAWPFVNRLIVSNSAKSEVARALGIGKR